MTKQVMTRDDPPHETVWDSLAPHARRRLRRRAAALMPSDEESDTAALDGMGTVRQLDSVSTGTKAGKLRKSGSKGRTKNDKAPTGSSPLAHPSRPQAAKRGDSKSSLPHTPQERRPRQLPVVRLGGFVASMALHAVFIVLLAIFTLKLPQRQSEFHLKAASQATPEPQLELVQPVELPIPQTEVAVAEATPSFELAESLGDLKPIDFTSSPVKSGLPAGLGEAVRLSASKGIPGELGSFFGASANGNNFCYVIDISGSMRGGPWEAARSELLSSLQRLRPQQRFFIILFTDELQVVPSPIDYSPAKYALYATPQNLQHVRTWLLALRIGGGGGPPTQALKLAIGMEPDAIYLLTDGVTRVRSVAKEVLAANRTLDLIHGEQIRVPIHAIAYYSLEGQQLLRQIAEENSGRFVFVPDPGN